MRADAASTGLPSSSFWCALCRSLAVAIGMTSPFSENRHGVGHLHVGEDREGLEARTPKSHPGVALLLFPLVVARSPVTLGVRSRQHLGEADVRVIVDSDNCRVEVDGVVE